MSEYGMTQEIPPTPKDVPLAVLGKSAETKLQEVGWNKEQVKQLQEVVGEYDYDNIAQKVDRFTQNDLFIAQDVNGDKYAVIPDFYQPHEGIQGNCTELSFKLIANDKFRGLISEANQKARETGGQELEICICAGQSEEFFNKVPSDSESGDFHQWVGLRVKGSAGKDSLLDIDPAMKSIHAATEHQYNHQQIYLPENGEIAHPITEKVKLGKVDIAPDGRIEGYSYEMSITLGMSADGKYAYDMGFLEDSRTGEIVPTLIRGNADATDQSIFFLNPKDGEVVGGGYLSLTDADIEEIGAILGAARNFRRNEDMSQFPYDLEMDTLEDTYDNWAVKTV